MAESTDFPVQFQGSALARRILGLLGWQVHFRGLPALHGVIVVYPHTSNWDFPVGLLAKWAMGLEAKFLGKHTLFRIPLFGAWLRWLGGVPVDRRAAGGVVEQMVEMFARKKSAGEYFWLALTPEGTRCWRCWTTDAKRCAWSTP
jgi:1-acyl-sn-glycerol-3-phosphate acyltransferase